MSSAPNPSVSAPDAFPQSSESKQFDYELLARLIVRDGKPFKQSALQAGYSRSVADHGLKALMDDSSCVRQAIQREWERINVGLDRLKPFAVRRLYSEIVDPGSMNAMRAIEIAGKFKETDWFVRNADMNLGVFIGMTDQTPETTPPDTFKE